MVYKFNFRIAYADTDAGGIVYHARYVEIAERARMDAFKDVNDPNGVFVIKELTVKYMKPLRLNDEFVVETTFKKSGAATMDIEQKFVKDGDNYAILTGIAVYVNKEMKPIRLSDAWLKMGD